MNEIVETMARIREEQAGAGRRAQYPDRVRRAAVKHWLSERRRGRRSAEVARELGVHAVSLNSWRRLYEANEATRESERSLPAIREVIIAEPEPIKTAIVVHGGAGARIEGMSVEQLTELLRGLQ